MSTVDYQDRASSSRWQLEAASELIAGHGRIVAEFFDEGVPAGSHGRTGHRRRGCSLK
jgi:hypothetical protein